MALFERAGWVSAAIWPIMTLGFVEMSLGDYEAAAALLTEPAAMIVAGGLAEPTAGGAMITGDAAEALVALGRVEEAEAIVALLESRGAALILPWSVAVAARILG